ncbi:ABC transporter substrate-binding protein [Wukongibacter baidiensis]|uniref:ABC transporter substrate-binding protein n=1 Tax=Wukongibacter baidiensis TaxID=1723361 RepID=UPI003D7FD4C5
MKRTIRAFSLLLGVILIINLMAVTGLAEVKDQLKIGLHSDESTLTPYSYVTGSPGHDLMNLVYDCLFQLDENNVPQPLLVKEYTLSEDKLVYTFKLHENVTWHDGTPFTAEDVKFTYDYIMKYPKSRFTRPSKAIEKIEVVDKYTLKFALSSVQPYFLIQPIADLPIMPKHIWDGIDKPDEASEKIGTGPYMLEEYIPGQFYKFKANDNYFMGIVTVKELILPIIKDTTSLFTALKAKDIDAVTNGLPPELVKIFDGAKSIKLDKGPGYSTTLLQFNNEAAPLNIKEFRKAIALAIDKENIIDTVLLGYGTPGSNGFLHPSSSGFNPNLPEHVQNLDEAKAILDNLNFKDLDNDGYREDDKGEKIELDLLVYANNPLRIRIAELIQSWSKEIGVKINLKAMDMNTVDSLVWPGFDVSKGRDYDMSMWGWSPSIQIFPARLVELYHSSTDKGTLNIGAYSNPEFDAEADKLDEEFEPEARQEILNKMQKVVSEDYPFIPLYYPEIVFAYNQEAYDGWTFIAGKGIINKLSFVSVEDKEEKAAEVKEEEKKEEPAKEEKSEKEEKDTPAPQETTETQASYSWVIIVLIIAVVAFFFRKKGSKE